MKIIIAGGRNYVPQRRHIEKIFKILDSNECKTIFSGGCNSGADLVGELIARNYGNNRMWGLVMYPADWEVHGKAAGPIRNEAMAKYADGCILLPGGSGTANMKKMAEKYGLKIWMIK